MKVLVVDDEPLVVWSLVKALGELKIDVEGAMSGIEALRKLKQGKYNLLITDFKMPDITGFELIKKLKKDNPDVKVILITAYASLPEIKGTIRSLQVNKVIEKPYKVGEVVQSVQEVLGNVSG